MLLAALTLALLACARACPPSCVCRQNADARDEMECQLPAGQVSILGALHDSIEIICSEDHVKCSELPEIPFSRNGSMQKLVVTDCLLDGPLSCWLGKFGVERVETLAFKGIKNELKPEHVEGLVGVRALRMFYSDAQHSIPLEVLAVLPELREFRLREASLPAPQPMNNLNLTYVELSSDGIEQLAESAFELAHLEQLHIWDNKIEKITADNFKGLPSLKFLDLSRNRIRVLPGGVFSHTPRLTKLSLNVNPIEEVESDALQGLTELKKIEAFDNAAPMRLSPHSLSNLPSLEVIEFKNCKIPSLPSDLLINSTQIINITITRNAIQVLPEGLFRDQQLLIKLDLSKNRIEEFSSQMFRPLGSLVELNLDDNLIKELPADIFVGVTKLRTLRMNNNQLHHIDQKALTHATALVNIFMSNNQLSLLTTSGTNSSEKAGEYQMDMYMEPLQSPFRTLFTLENLDLSRNRISHIFDDWRFLMYQNIKVLNLSRNTIRDLTDADTQFLSDREDTIIDLRLNQISRVVLSNPFGFMPEELFTKTLQSTILLDGNPFICDCANQNFILKLHNKFPYYSRIPKLDVGNARCMHPSKLNGTLVRDIDPTILTCPLRDECPKECSCEIRPSYKRLEMTCSSVPVSLPDPTKHGMISTDLKLTKLTSSFDLPSFVDNLILSDLHIDNLQSIPYTVHHIDLTNSGLKKIPIELLRRNMTLKLTGNPFLCDCSNQEDVQLLKDNRFKVVDNATVKCWDAQSPWQIDVPRLCSVQRAAILGTSLAIFSIILIILAGLYYRYSLEIKIYIYSCEKLRWLIAEDDIDKDKRYDAFISFSHKDEKFVAEKLIPVLESGSRPFKLCVHYRDWIVGEWIPAQIVNSVEQSRRTIIVLSKGFVESVWGTMEFRVAHKRAQEEKRTRIVVILLEDAPPASELDAELRAYLSTNTYVKWGDPWFWEKLRYALAGGRVGSVGETKEKTPKGGLNAYLNSNGQIVNDSKDTMSTGLSMTSN